MAQSNSKRKASTGAPNPSTSFDADLLKLLDSLEESVRRAESGHGLGRALLNAYAPTLGSIERLMGKEPKGYTARERRAIVAKIEQLRANGLSDGMHIEANAHRCVDDSSRAHRGA